MYVWIDECGWIGWMDEWIVISFAWSVLYMHATSSFLCTSI